MKNINTRPLGVDIDKELSVIQDFFNKDSTVKPLLIVLSGSYLYGTNDSGSDVDIRGIFINNNERILSNNYINVFKANNEGQVKELSKDGKDKQDIILTELRDFLIQLYKNSPSAIEQLFAREECIIYMDEAFRKVFYDVRKKYLSQLIIQSYGDYNISQIKKANNKSVKSNYKKRDIQRLPITNFVNIHLRKKGYFSKENLTEYLSERGMYEEFVGLSGSNLYTAYYDWYSHYDSQKGLTKYLKYFFKKGLSFKGIARENSNDVRKTVVPRLSNVYCLGLCTYNQLEYSKHCAEYNEYIHWNENANHDRYKNLDGSDKDVIDGKNMLHSIRCADMFHEMMKSGDVVLLRKNIDFLMEIKRGNVGLSEILEYVNEKFSDEAITVLKENTPLPKIPNGNRMEEELNFRKLYGNF
jgi:predicted nucleotidyltransferase